MKVGFIGLGNVGGKLAGSLLRNDYDLMVRALDRDVAQAFVDGGARFAGALGVPLATAKTLIAVTVVAFAATSLDTGARIQRLIIAELALCCVDDVAVEARECFPDGCCQEVDAVDDFVGHTESLCADLISEEHDGDNAIEAVRDIAALTIGECLIAQSDHTRCDVGLLVEDGASA